MSNNTKNGKAFEYACLKEIEDVLKNNNKIVFIKKDNPFKTAEKCFNNLNKKQSLNYKIAAKRGIQLIQDLEPNLCNGKGDLKLSIASDSIAIGKKGGDVRDVIAIRNENNPLWEIGISCKHNHEALKHPRITKDYDFGFEWIGKHCSTQYFKEITPVMDKISNLKYSRWNQVPNKKTDYYKPVLNAFKNELKILCKDSTVPKKIVSYFFGTHDFYKIMMQEKSRSTTIQGFNINGTLGKSVKGQRSRIPVPQISLPTKLLQIEFKEPKKNDVSTTLRLTFDKGWVITMRLHNKDSKPKPTSLAWDVKLEGIPTGMFSTTQLW